ncbi:Transmembrane protein 45A [Trema orientale]|uniref:Transmembrane protein 45A n=1 Tax=Trema orientale TaxID=63057 RepID=A0A2P5CWP1_TREOI|nr:Transmembrane protein 45A [Trema orientale]
MGTFVGHVGIGLVFFLIGLWHLLNHIKLHAFHPNSYTAPLWFPSFKFRYAEPFLIMAASVASISMDLFIGPKRHQPLDRDGTIPFNHINNFEQASISFAMFVYAAFLVILDRTQPKVSRSLGHFLASIAFAQELLLSPNSTDHITPIGQYHFFQRLVILVTLTTFLMGIGFPNSFMVSFVRSLSIFFQGVWFIVTGVMLYTPEFMPKGCLLYNENGRKVIRCSGEEALHRANSLIKLEFSWLLIGTAIFGVSFYLVFVKIYGQKFEYFYLGSKEEHEGEEESDYIESQKKIACTEILKTKCKVGKVELKNCLW